MYEIVINPSHQLHNKCLVCNSEANHCYIIGAALHKALTKEGLVKSYFIGHAPSSCKTEAERRKWSIRQSNAINKTHIGIHTNAYNGKTRGSEALYYSSAGKKLSSAILGPIADIIGPNRGVKERKNLEELNATKAVACIIEIGFHDNIDDANKIHKKAPEIVEALKQGIYNYFGIKIDTNWEKRYNDLVNDLCKLISKYEV